MSEEGKKKTEEKAAAMQAYKEKLRKRKREPGKIFYPRFKNNLSKYRNFYPF
jgi:hypothetical protein